MHNKKKVRLFSDAGEFEELVKKLPDAKLLQNMGLQLQSIDFEKDNENNFHMDFITAASNLRAANYGITPTDKFEVSLNKNKIDNINSIIIIKIIIRKDNFNNLI